MQRALKTRVEPGFACTTPIEIVSVIPNAKVGKCVARKAVEKFAGRLTEFQEEEISEIRKNNLNASKLHSIN